MRAMADKVVLYIEDNPQNMRLVEKILTKEGYTLLQAVDGISGVELAKARKPHLILMDINLPDIDGMEATNRLKSDESVKHIPIIALTANAMPGDRERFIEAGCDGYMSKPLSRGDLLEMVAEYFAKITLANTTDDAPKDKTITVETVSPSADSNI
jgi:two-component system, cell cycle response regulator DivK